MRFWAVILLAIAVLLFFLEVMVPSGGMIGLLAAVATVAGIVMLFRIHTVLGLAGAIGSLTAVPFLFFFALKLWPNTPIAQMLLLKQLPSNSTDTTRNHDTALEPGLPVAGAKGQALTDLRPVGTCMINGQRQQCLATTGLIRAGSRVRVVSTDGIQIKVRSDDGP